MYNYTIEALKAISRVVANESWERKQVYGGDNSRRKNLEMEKGKKGMSDKNDTDQWGKTKYREKLMIPFFVPL